MNAKEKRFRRDWAVERDPEDLLKALPKFDHGGYRRGAPARVTRGSPVSTYRRTAICEAQGKHEGSARTGEEVNIVVKCQHKFTQWLISVRATAMPHEAMPTSRKRL